MRRIIALILACAILIGCSATNNKLESDNTTQAQTTKSEEYLIEFESLSDTELLSYIEDNVYSELVSGLNSEKYLVENISSVYISKEYLEEVAYNTQENIFFGFTLAEVEAAFEGKRYVFTLGDDGKTTVTEFVEYVDPFQQILKNVAIGTGVILLSVTVSLLTANSAPAVSVIFAVSAKSGTVAALSSGTLGGLSAGIIEGVKTGDFDKALSTAMIEGSEAFKWGAISGVISGGLGETIALKGATLNGLTMNEAALIQKESGYPLSVIKQFHSFDEYTVFKQAGLQAELLGGNLSLVRTDIDLYNVVDEYGRNNFTRMSKGLNPIDGSGNTFQWHHIGQQNDATLALLTASEHDAGALHGFKVVSEIDRASFDTFKKTLNKDLLKWLLNNEM
ncbi:MAG: hypothetical protein IJ457_09210 [Clostridia bacterium]|nr:hypothetical protein [Clostridia bacterium]